MSKNKLFYKKKNNNPALTQMKIENRIKKSMDEATMQGRKYAVLVYSILLAMVLSDKTRLTDEEIQKVINELDRMADSVIGDYMTIPDVVKTIKEEYNIKLSNDDLLKYYPELEGYLDLNEEDNK